MKTKTIYFTTSTALSISKIFEKELGKIEKDIEKGGSLSPAFDDILEAISCIKKDG